MRPTRRSDPPSSRAISRPMRAAGGPACWEPGSHGPRVSSVGTYRSPSGTKKHSDTRRIVCIRRHAPEEQPGWAAGKPLAARGDRLLGRRRLSRRVKEADDIAHAGDLARLHLE